MASRRLQGILRTLRQQLAGALGDQFAGIYLYGSVARGEATDCSDIDVLVVVRGTFDYYDLIRRTSPSVSALSLKHGVVISRAFVSEEQFQAQQSPFLLNVRREGVAI